MRCIVCVFHIFCRLLPRFSVFCLSPVGKLCTHSMVVAAMNTHLVKVYLKQSDIKQRFYIGFPGCVTDKNSTLFSKLG